MRDLHLRWQRVRIDREAMILGCDLDLTRIELLHRMVGAAVAELQFERLTSNRKPENLVTETDAERRNIRAHQLPNVVDGVGQRCGIPWSVAEKDPVRLDRDQLACRCGRGKHT